MTKAFVCLDLSQLREYAFDANQLPDLMETFATSLAKERSALQALMLRQDGEAIRSKVDAIKGFAPIFCKPPLAQEIIQLEALSRQQSLEDPRPRLNYLLKMLAALEQDVKHWRERQAADPNDPSLLPPA